MPLKNPWIGYVERDYFSAKSAIVSKLPYQLPEMTDHSESNPFIKLVDIFAGILEHTNYYIDRRAREVFLVTLVRFVSALKIARSYDYRVKGTNPASVDLRFYLTNPTTDLITIPIGTEVKTKDGISFYTTAVGTIPVGEVDAIVPAIQSYEKPDITIGVSDGTPFQQFELESNVVDNSISIVVSSDNFTPVETLSIAQGDDFVFVGSINENAKMSVEFGDDINGEIPSIGQDVVATYSISQGAIGNVAENTITEISTAVTVPSGYTLLCTNVQRASGGVDIESVTDLKKRIPKSIRTNERAVTDLDFVDTAEMVNGVAKAAHDFDCGLTVPVYIVPVGGGAASTFLKRSVKNFFENRRPVNLKVDVFSAGDVRVLFDITLNVLPNYSRSGTKTNVMNNIIEFMSEENQNIKGTVRIGDVYEVIENTEGVDWSEINIMSVLPFAIPVKAAPDLIWTRSILQGSMSTSTWLLKVISGSSYQLYRNNSSMGTFDFGIEYEVGVIVGAPELLLNVTDGGYTLGDRWNFTTYRYSGTVQIVDLSIPTSQAENIVITATGGI